MYHGFRYIRVDNFPGTAAEAATAVHGLFLHSDVAPHGNVTIDLSTAEGRILAAVHAAVVQTQACNIYSVPTDCPQREKRGWMGDAQWTAEEALLNFDMTALYSNWVRTMNDLQDTGCTPVQGAKTEPMSDGTMTNSFCCLPTPVGADPLHPKKSFCSPQYNQTDHRGSIPDVVPNNWGSGGSRGWPGAPTWSGAYVIIPGHIMQYGDNLTVIHRHYAGIKAHVDFLARQSKYGAGVPQFGMLGDWCSVEPFCPGSSDGCLASPGWTSGDATTAFYFIKSLEDLIKMAKLTEHKTDVHTYTQMLSSAKAGYHKVFFNTTTQDYGASQTGNALAIAAGIPPDAASMAGALATLTANIEARGKHLSTGGVGTRWLLQALSIANRTALAMDLATQITAPSWYDFVRAGPGTLHEQWGTAELPPSNEACTSGCTMVAVAGARYWAGVGDQPLPGASAASSAEDCSAACLHDIACVQMTWAPAHQVKCSLYTSIKPGAPLHNPQCTASAVKCKQGAVDPAKCAPFGGPGHPANEHAGSQNHM